MLKSVEPQQLCYIWKGRLTDDKILMTNKGNLIEKIFKLFSHFIHFIHILNPKHSPVTYTKQKLTLSQSIPRQKFNKCNYPPFKTYKAVHFCTKCLQQKFHFLLG